MAEIQHTPATLQRIETERRERVSRRASQGRHFQVEPDHIVPGAFLVRNPKIPGTVEIVTAAGECSCRRYRVWGACRHAARVEEPQGATR